MQLPEDCLAELARTLSPEEWDRSQGLGRPELRCRFIASRGMLRSLLGQYLGELPERIRFSYGDRGKPSLADSPVNLQFNLSHSQDLVLYAFAYQIRVGVDGEHRRLIRALARLARRFFSDREYGAIAALPPDQQTDRFLQVWACREAYLKAIGEGLVGLGNMEIRGLEQGTPVVWLWREAEWQPANQWRLHLLQPDPGYVAALAIENGDQYQLACWSFPNWPGQAME
ncbi:4'-phosphopantetheinyl transferase superfamily protein [Leptolyngbya sp. 'hensonii']|uniref:4'-phosphopantetheinyl transferase family protein n=1 Tax=Leptolyngbya sp. 'hensonii' TaxID=1922337 RepID=UPI0015C53CA0|nr:4'-phosphopantetheinyl transferase superfamily protein [Leptolyngbya sp. 'hensonii']